MPLPLAHALVGASIGVTFAPDRSPTGRRRGLLVGALLGVCPDIDFVLGSLHVVRWSWHHGATHSIAFALIVGVIAARACGLRGGRGTWACVLAALSHPLLDFVITESPGVALGWPVTSRRVKLGIDAVSYYHLTRASEGTLALVKLCAAELVLFGPLFALAVVASGRRPASRTTNTRSW
jgi:membrane-bound metal-dependent hydrolase YbcI (DUF457 family)